MNYKGKDIQDSDLIAVGLKAGLKKEEMINEIANIGRIVAEHLSEYLK